MRLKAGCRDMEEIGHHKRQTNRGAVVPIVGVVLGLTPVAKLRL